MRFIRCSFKDLVLAVSLENNVSESTFLLIAQVVLHASCICSSHDVRGRRLYSHPILDRHAEPIGISVVCI